jgi:glycosyltransferase involved in cell wall biosynthesis
MTVRGCAAACRALGRDIDVVHVQTPFVAHRVGVAIGAELGVPVVETYHTFFEEYVHHYLPLLPRFATRGFARAVSRRLCNAVDAVVAPSSQLADVLRGYGVEAPVEVIPTGLDLRELEGGDGAAFRAHHGIAPGRPTMLVVGRVAHEKNLVFLLDVLARVRASIADALLVIAGEGPALPSLRRAVAARGLGANVLFVGYLDRNGALRDCYRAADVFVFASRTETQGLVLLEALALGTPVVSTAVLGTREVLAHARGALVVREDVDEFAAATIKVLDDAKLRTALAAQARGYVASNWSSREMARRLVALFERASAATSAAAQLAR